MTAAQDSLFDEPGQVEASPARIEQIAKFFAGWKWPGSSWHQLGAKRREAALEASREVHRRLAQGDQ